MPNLDPWRRLAVYLAFTVVLVLFVGLNLLGCTSARFAPPPTATYTVPQAKGSVPGAPFTREKEDALGR
jgi:hypothetical protein